MSSTTNKPTRNPATMATSMANTSGSPQPPGNVPGIDPGKATTLLAEAPRPLSEQELALAATGIQTLSAAAAAEPTMSPPGTPGAIVAIEGAATWLTGKKVVALWSNRGPRNAYAYLEGVGWKRMADTNDSAHSTLSMLASAARQTGSIVHVRDEGDGRAREIYVW
jgi:hypothetical protein